MRERAFAIGALGRASAGLTTPDPDHLELKLPFGDPDAVVRMSCACGIVSELDSEDLKKLQVDVPAEGCANKYLSVETCPFCSEAGLGNPRFLPIPD